MKGSGHCTLNMIFHPLCTSLQPPVRLNNPFYYEPDDLCRLAMDQLVAYLGGDPQQSFSSEGMDENFRAEIGNGKMFGVLIVQNNGKLGYLAGYSGQIVGRSDWPDFVPAVFDYLQPDGYFKIHEAEISAINRHIRELEQGKALLDAHKRLEDLKAEQEKAIQAFKASHPSKQKEGESKDELIRRRQFENAELHRLRKKYRVSVEAALGEVDRMENEIRNLRQQRRQKSDNLQSWLFRQFRLNNGKGDVKDIEAIFHEYGLLQDRKMVAPAGSGECCEPKMLQYAFLHGMQPVSMAMFWWGKSPKEEVRRHLQCYPACSGKCKPLLWWMLQGVDVAPNPLEDNRHLVLPIVFEDEDICVVCKPSGMLSVPGKSARESVYSLMKSHCKDAEGPLIVHRLDMATSGLMVIAKNWTAYHCLQGQFLRHEVKKRYVARLSRTVNTEKGVLTLPLRPDLDDRPRQMVDPVYGKEATTFYQKIDDRHVALYPQTGRTHQLRVHCAHPDGLDNPIEGDELYGQRGRRLCLHAEQLTFCHPRTGERMTFEWKADFDKEP